MIRSYLHYPFWGIFSTVLLLCTNSLIGLTTSTNTTPLSESEFEFDDNEFPLMQKSKVVTTFIDDEDLLNDAGSGDEGSGIRGTPLYPDFYRIKFYITYLRSTDGLSNRNSENFRRVSTDINSAISSLFNKAVRVNVFKYELREQGAVVSMDLGTRENMNELVIKSLLSTQLQSGRLGNFRVSADGFSFNPLGDTSCPTEVGRKPTKLAWTGENLARLMINNMFPCDGYVTGWAYYVAQPTEVFAATIWRPVDEFKFNLLSKHLLPATQMGYNEFTLSSRVKVEKGDFLGLHYPKTATSGAIAGSTRERSDVPADELYEVYTGELYDGQMSVNAEFDMKWLNFEKTRASFAIQAKLNYSGIDETFPPRDECTDNEFKCRDGTCIQKNYHCDNQVDCPDGSDEEKCGAGCQTNEFRCRSGDCVPYSSYCDNRRDCEDGSDEEDCPLCGANEFRCGDGVCLSQMKRCDSHVDCTDASDEYGCESVPCRANQFRCEGGLCIDQRLKCDGVVNCPDTSDELDCPNRTCSSNQYRCDSGQCVPLNIVCDNKRDCPDGSDELRKACAFVCKPGGFKCNDGSCIRETQKCDRQPDCRDGSDELNCDTVCRPGEFRCQNGDCIPETRRCDGRPDCRDATDEFNCQCRSGQFRCRNGQCINEQGVCNRRRECHDGSDEEDCPIQACQRHEFQCRDGQCIDARRKCDRYPDCADRSDESDCPVCRSNQFQCRDGQCIAKRKKCDGRPDCRDRSDESGCPSVTCGSNEFTCGDGQCIPSSKRCNREYDCRDGSDERNCTQCRDGEFRCKNGRCIPENRICDGRNDCSDGSDESDCAACRASEFKCKSGECVSVRQKCNGRKDCLDGSDEMGCETTFTISINPGSLRVRTGSRAVFTCDVRGASVQTVDWRRRSGSQIDERRSQISGHRLVINEIRPTDADDYICTVIINGQEVTATANLGVDLLIPFVVTVTPRVLTVQEGETAKFMCQMSGSYSATLQWTRSQRRALTSRATDLEGILMINSVTQEDAGEYVCNAYGDQGRTTGTVQLIVNGIGPGTERPEGPCRRGEATCNNGQCIPADYRCDGEEDCSDGSDEFQCSQPLPCEPNEFKCRNGRCAMKIWRCDGDNDCGDGSDEENCPTGAPGSMCEMDEFRCIARHQCIPSSYQCDGENDCLDRSDEMGCRPPTIISPPIKDIEVEIGGTFTIFCEAIGIPVPLIIWRLNWGNIPTGDRVVTTSKDGKGMLTISNARLEDAGAYTCEAMNNKGSIFALPDAIVIVKRPSGNCPPPVFNAIAASREECIQCFCFKRTIQCDSSNLKKVWLTMGSHVNLVNRRGDTLPDANENYIRYDGSKREFRIPSYQFLPSGVYYFSLPYQFLGNRLTSYGGELNYKVFYEMAGLPVPIDEPDVIITGNGISLYHTVSRKLTPNREHSIKIPFREQVWQKQKLDPEDKIRSDTPAVDEATREDLMEVLANVTSVMIKATIDSSQTDIRINGIIMNGGTPQGRGDRTVLVEECDCPTGYDGLSCEKCAKGYYMIDQGRYGTCVPCNCNGRSNDCDPITGECIDCQANTGGARCDICEDGYFGNPLQGIECEPCPCPHTSGQNQFSRRCKLGRNGRVRCLDCPEGYTGNQCEICAQGYIGNPRVAGDYCRPLDEACDLRGSRSRDPNPVTNQCECKGNTKGERCDRCKESSFYLSKQNPEGCISCFCMGVSVHCTSTSRRRTQIGTSFIGDRAGFSLVNMEQTKRIKTGFNVNSQKDLVYRNFYSQTKQVYYWSLPNRYLGNKLTAYGGFLRYTISNIPGINNSPTLRAADVEIMGNDIMLFYYSKGNITQDRPTSFEIPMYEHHWKMANGNFATREYLLMALADLRSILIKATYTVDTDLATIRDVTLDIAEQRVSGERADAVEECSCPDGYRGLSCELCDVGYRKTVKGLYLRLCEQCECNGHSSECDPETGKCRNCQHNTEGDHCDRCVPGYYGNATGGSIYDCMKCPCPLVEQPNQFSPTCYLDRRDGRATCNACPAGHTGRNCEKCLPGFSGNPLHPGDYCKASNISSCSCDTRGTIKNTQCDPDTKQCQCKAYVQRLKCDSCKENYFHLSNDNPQGCLACYCMGITNKCTSSNFYRTKVTPLFGTDGSHNFMLTNRAMSRTINDGFRVDASRNEISFESFTDVQRERESLYFQLPPKFRGDKVTSYGGYLEFTLEFDTAQGQGNAFRETDVEIISSGQRLHYLFNTQAQESRPNTYRIHLVEKSFNMWDGSNPSREVFMTVLANIDAILIRATYHTMMTRATLRDVSIEIAVPGPTGQPTAPMVEKCTCPEGYAGLSCQECALGYSRIKDERTGLGRCGRCNCHDHSSTCDPRTGKCLNCKHNTMGDRCELCKPGYYGDASVGTSGDCRPCACPLTIPSNNFSPTCYLAQDNKITCDKCQRGYTGRNCDLCASGYSGNPRTRGDHCKSTGNEKTPVVIVNPINIRETIGNTAVFTCRAESRDPSSIVWSRVDGRRLPSRAQQNYREELVIENLTPADTGRYVCIATNSHGSSKAFVELVVSRTIGFQVRIEEPVERKVDVGATVRLVCSIVGQHSSAYVLSWSRVDGVLPRSALEFDGVLTLQNVKPEDAGEYTCTGSDPESVATAVAIIIVGTSTSPPVVAIEPRYQTISVGQSAKFVCTATGSPRPTITWYKGENQPLGGGVISRDGVLTFPRVTKLHESEYYCVATNSMGTTKVRTLMYVTGDSPTIEIIIRQQSIVTSVGKRIELVCSVQENGQLVNLIWTKQGGRLPSGATQRNGVLVINSAQPSDSGVYICTGTTQTGSTGTNRAVVTISNRPVGVRPTARIEPDGLITISQKTTGTLRCIVTGEPTPTITWSKARGELSRNHKVNGNVLRITQTMIEDRGVYICKASNIAGTVQASAIVEVERRELPQIDMYPKETQTVRAGGSALFQCRLTAGIPSPAITWSRVGGEQMTSHAQVMDNGVIRFTGVSSEDQGGYVCSAVNVVGTITSTATLVVSGPPKIIINQRQVRVKVGDHVRIECTAEGDPLPNVYWQHGLPHRYDVSHLPPARDSVAVLEINSVTAQDAKFYTCIAENQAGRAQERVELIVKTTEIVDRPRDKNRLNVNEGEKVVVTCETQGFTGSRITWRRRRGPLPPGHSVSNGILTIPRITKDYDGEYVCTTTTLEGTFEVSFMIIVSVAPRVTISPSNVSARPGEPLRLFCRAEGSGPISIEWMKTSGVISPTVEERNGVLIFKEVTAADAGEYRCIAKSSSGVATGIVLVKVVVQPVVKVTQNEVTVRRGQTVTLECQTTGTPPPTVRWEKYGGPLPANHDIRDGVLTIFGVTEEDEGRYICTATNDGGSARDYIYLKFTTIHQPETIPKATQTTNVGDKVEFDCIVSTIHPNPKTTWSKLEGPISEEAIYGKGVLIIPKVRVEDAGTYVCTLEMSNGTPIESRISLFVKSRPQIDYNDNFSTAPLGTPTTLGCTAQGTPQPLITWSKENGNLPSEHSIVDGNLYIPKVRPEDAGTYYCSASNSYDTVRHAVTLQVSDLVPNFVQNPVSYIEYPPLKNAYLDFDIVVSFRPSVTDGLILYNGQETENGDFLCFGLRERYPEFRFNVGSGPAIIRGNQTLDLDKWYTIQLKRDRREGMMLIDGQPVYTGTAPGRFQGLDLDQSFYLGGVPDYRIIPQSVGFDQGFVGGVSQVQISGNPLDLGGDALNVVGIDQFRVCDASPCYNGGSCIPKNMKFGYSCMCPQGFAGFQCETTGERCFPGACGPTGRCQDLPGLSGFKCVCPIGRLGRGCQEGMTVKDPFFNKTSFISYPPIDDGHKMLSVDILMKPHVLQDGIILYSGQQENGNGDFVALVIKDGGYIEFRFDVGSGPAIIRSAKPVRAKEWIHIHIQRDGNTGMMVIDGQDPVRVRPGTINNDPFSFRGDSSPGDRVGLNLRLPLYLGGVDPRFTVASGVGSTQGFIGCIGEIEINDRPIHLIKDAVESSDINDCGEKRLCDRMPCKNGGLCEDVSSTEFLCICEPNFSGKRCESKVDICTNNPCQNAGLCTVTNAGYRCDCQLGYIGLNCENSIILHEMFQLAGNGFVVFSHEMLPHQTIKQTQNISFTITTAESKGLLFWQAVDHGQSVRKNDYLSIYLKDGFVVFSYELGSGPAEITTNFTVNDSLPHNIQAIRNGPQGRLIIDGQQFRGRSQGVLQMLNVKGNIFVGGVPDLSAMTGGLHDTNFFGCMDKIFINNNGPLKLSQSAIGGLNVRHCENAHGGRG